MEPTDSEQIKLTLKQRAWLKAYFSTGNATEAARQAGYRCKSDEHFASIGAQNCRKLQPVILKWLDEEKLSDVELKKQLIEGLKATETRFFSFKGEVTERIEVVAWETRRRYLDMAFKHRGLYAPDKLNVDHSGGITVVGTGYPEGDE